MSAYRSGSLLAVASAISFGLTTPIIAAVGRDVGPLVTASLLYAGACTSALLLGLTNRGSGAGLSRTHAPRLILIAVLGAAVAPTLLAWGLQRAGATTGSLLLNLEAVFTVLAARAFYREPTGPRVVVAVVLMIGAGALLAVDGARGAGWSLPGAAAIAAATLAWALDNTLTRPLSNLDPVRVVAAKGALGAALTGVVALVRGEGLPATGTVLALLACGATGYGLSLRLYLMAQRRMGAARTGSVFALAPFIGAAVAWLAGARTAGAATAGAAALFAAAVYLHLTERHRHRHVHAAVSHDHPHRHDDGHHDHVHVPPVVGEHAHPHSHHALDHDHEHAPDLHHQHAHEAGRTKLPPQ